eukprot:CAMPEP_0180419414 /NCGR_PEP_ID=MMETSP1036_2-20121128/2081_1 /TAXON_ID=632150 /ORGANISM="Azadinium spinosum, Strain 3D9" /LENGTH=90 /DNA_ID=CAMNT_0022424563 /DNA_START=448 /DNA_END=721 /DNA_ORIENTATION=+
MTSINASFADGLQLSSGVERRDDVWERELGVSVRMAKTSGECVKIHIFSNLCASSGSSLDDALAASMRLLEQTPALPTFRIDGKSAGSLP